MTSCLPIIGQEKATPIGCILSDSPGTEPGSKSDIYDCLVFVVVVVFCASAGKATCARVNDLPMVAA